MTDIYELERQFDKIIKTTKGEEKKQSLTKLQESTIQFEREACRDWAIPFDLIKRNRKLNDLIEAGINRLTAAVSRS